MINQFTKTQTVLEFGHGDIAVCPATHKDGKDVALFLRNGKPGKIGPRAEEFKDGLENSDVIMKFNSVESIDILIKSLKFAKKELKKGLKQ